MPEARADTTGSVTVNVPDDRLYSPDHLWALSEGDLVRVGITPWIVRVRSRDTSCQMRLPPVGTVLRAAEIAGEIETAKLVVDLFAPCDGVVESLNPVALTDAHRCLEDPWNHWLWRMRSASTAMLWSAPRYAAALPPSP